VFDSGHDSQPLWRPSSPREMSGTPTTATIVSFLGVAGYLDTSVGSAYTRCGRDLQCIDAATLASWGHRADVAR
jgi:hypothetical protein